MKRSVFLAVVAVLALTGSALAQAPESFVGTVKSVTGNAITVEHGTITGTFAFDAKTHVTAKGATTKTNENKAAGKAGLTVPDVIHAGDQVRVRYTYSEKSNTMTVNDIALLESLAKK